MQFSILDTAVICAGHPANVVRGPVDDTTAVRFFFNPGNYFHPPMIFRVVIFRVVSRSDPRLDTVPLLATGRTVYISGPDMQSLKTGLVRLGLNWAGSGDSTTFGDATEIPPNYVMDITVISLRGTATAGFDPGKICDILAPLDEALGKRRALWELKLFQSENKCRVPGLDGSTYPDHWPWNQPQK